MTFNGIIELILLYDVALVALGLCLAKCSTRFKVSFWPSLIYIPLKISTTYFSFLLWKMTCILAVLHCVLLQYCISSQRGLKWCFRKSGNSMWPTLARKNTNLFVKWIYPLMKAFIPLRHFHEETHCIYTSNQQSMPQRVVLHSTIFSWRMMMKGIHTKKKV
jgi:hypothetical protein